MRLSDSVLRKVIDGYAREAGVRILDQLLGRIVRKAVVQFLEKDLSKITISLELIRGSARPSSKNTPARPGCGQWFGLDGAGWNHAKYRSHPVPGQGRGFKQTGQLGSVMQESAQIAYSYVAGAAEELKLDPDFSKMHLFTFTCPRARHLKMAQVPGLPWQRRWYHSPAVVSSKKM